MKSANFYFINSIPKLISVSLEQGIKLNLNLAILTLLLNPSPPHTGENLWESEMVIPRGESPNSHLSTTKQKSMTHSHYNKNLTPDSHPLLRSQIRKLKEGMSLWLPRSAKVILDQERSYSIHFDKLRTYKGI